MAKSKSNLNENIFYCNILIFLALVCLYNYLSRPLTEGIRNMNCCGGVEAGVHYSETDKKPPAYIRRCFQSHNDNGETVYNWNGFPCTRNGVKDCCGKNGSCTASSKGGYCTDSDGNNFIYKRRSGEETSPYIKRSNDDILDINDVNDMKDYYYDRRQSSKSAGMSREMQRFMTRRSKNEAYMEQALIDKKSTEMRSLKDAKEALDEQHKNIQIVYWITLIHLFMLLTISIVVKEEIIIRIQGYIDVVYLQYLKFSGKTI